MKLRDKKYFPDCNVDCGFFARRVELSNLDDNLKDKVIIGLPRCFHAGNGRHIDAKFVYSLIGLTVVDNSKESEIAVVLPDGWHVVTDNDHSYWSVLCDRSDCVVLDLFIKRHAWFTEDEFARFPGNDEETINDYLYHDMCSCCPGSMRCHEECESCDSFNEALDDALKYFDESKEVDDNA